MVALLTIFVRAELDESAEIEPANSSTAVFVIVAVAPAPTIGDPEVTLNRKLPAFTAVLPPYMGAAVRVNCPAPALVKPPPLLAVVATDKTAIEPATFAIGGMV